MANLKILLKLVSRIWNQMQMRRQTVRQKTWSKLMMSQEQESKKTWNKPLIVIPNSSRCLPYIEGVRLTFGMHGTGSW